MRHFKLLTVIALCVAMLLSATSCTQTTKTQILTDADIIGEDGRFIYDLIYSELDGQEVKDEVSNMSQQLRETFDIRVNRNSDDTPEPEVDAFEILIGNTNRTQSNEAAEELKNNRINSSNDYIIKVTGQKIVIYSPSSEALLQAMRYFTTTFCIGYEEFGKLGEGFRYVYEQEYALSDARINDISLNEYTIIAPAQKSLLWSEKVTQLKNNFKTNAGFDLKIANDSEPESAHEIIIGNTNRSQKSNAVGNDWTVEVIDGKLVVGGGNDIAISAAIDSLISFENECAANKEPFTIPAGYSNKGTAVRNATDYYLAWNDEFNGREINRSFWKDYKNNTITSPSCMGGTVFKPDARDVYVKNGSMYVPAKRLSKTDFQHGQITTQGTLAARYGIIEMRVKFPEYPITTALWANSVDYELINSKKVVKKYALSMELDIVESFGSETSYAANVHNWFSDEDIHGNTVEGHTSLDGGRDAVAKKFKYKGTDTLADAYHIYTLRWTPYEMSFAFDGEVYYTFDVNGYEKGGDFTQQPQFFLVGAAYGSQNYGPAYIEDDAPLESAIVMDYFRIYQSDTYDNILWSTPIDGYTPDLTVASQNAQVKR